MARWSWRYPRVPARRARNPRDVRPGRRARARPCARLLEVLPLMRGCRSSKRRVFAPSRSPRRPRDQRCRTAATIPASVLSSTPACARQAICPAREVTLLQIEGSRVRGHQRAGRCGQVPAGVCVRLYGEDELRGATGIYRTRDSPQFARGGSPAHGGARSRCDGAPFLSSSRRARAIADGYRVLQELGAVDGQRGLTTLGRELARSQSILVSAG